MSPSASRILFGGSFDPVQRAHRVLAERALASRPGAELVVIPAGAPPHKRRVLSPGPQRLVLCELAFAELPGARVSDEEIRRAGTSYSIDTVRRHRAELGDAAELCWLLGSDSLLDLGSWRDVHELLRICRILTVPRPGFSLDGLESLAAFDAAERELLRAGILTTEAAPAIRATEIRARLAAGEDVQGELHPAVHARILREGWYGSGPASGPRA